MYKCEHFGIQELVDKATFDRWGEQAWMFFNPDALRSIDGIRRFFTRPVTINNWSIGGPFSQRGLRVATSVGAAFSLHKFGCAFDMDIAEVTPEDARQEILANADAEELKLINCIEMDVNWLHMDCRNIADRIRKVYP